MLYQFNQSVHFHGKDYARGLHDITDEKVEYDQHFIKYVGLGLIVQADEAAVISPQSIADRQKRVHEELLRRAQVAKSKKAGAPAPARAPEAPKAVEPPVAEQAQAQEAANDDAEMASEKASDQASEAPKKAEKADKKKKG